MSWTPSRPWMIYSSTQKSVCCLLQQHLRSACAWCQVWSRGKPPSPESEPAWFGCELRAHIGRRNLWTSSSAAITTRIQAPPLKFLSSHTEKEGSSSLATHTHTGRGFCLPAVMEARGNQVNYLTLGGISLVSLTSNCCATFHSDGTEEQLPQPHLLISGDRISI